jgi:hypothetical protein
MIRRLALAALAVACLADLALADEVAPPPAKHQPPPASRQAPNAGPRLRDPFEQEIAPVPSRPPPPPRIVVAPEIARLGKQLAGTYRCKGVALVGDGSSTPLAGKLAIKLALGDAWIASSFVETGRGGVKLDDYRTYDATAKQWTRIRLSSTSAHVIETTLGERGGTWTWEGSELAPTGTTQVRDHEQIAGRQIRIWGEALLSGTWQKMYEATCKR